MATLTVSLTACPRPRLASAWPPDDHCWRVGNPSPSSTRGLLLSSLTAGTDSAGDVGTYYENYHVLNGTAKSLVYQLGAAHTELVADIYVLYIDLT